MKFLLMVICQVLIVVALCLFASAFEQKVEADDNDVNRLELSELQIKVTSRGYSAVFALYDTHAARELYVQLPLKLNLDNFRNAQWMFYPPEKLHVSAEEAYHDGKAGELSYYAPWGDVFMLYKDFYAGDEMHRLGINTSGADKIALMAGQAVIEKYIKKDETKMKIKVTANGESTVFELNGSQAANELYGQLPMSLKVDDYAGKEKIFYPSNKLGVDSTPLADAQVGTLAYYAPWGDVVMFYKGFGCASGLYELGNAVEGSENIKSMSGTLEIVKY